MNIINKSLIIAELAHKNQFRKSKNLEFTKLPYVYHPIFVKNILQKLGVTSELLLSASLLHDLFEDTKFNESNLKEMLSDVASDSEIETITQIINLLTFKDRDEKSSKSKKISQIEQIIESDSTLISEALLIKLVDMFHNSIDHESSSYIEACNLAVDKILTFIHQDSAPDKDYSSHLRLIAMFKSLHNFKGN